MNLAGRNKRDGAGISVRVLKKSLRGRAVLRGVDLTVAPGELSVIEGGNGAGKTTLIRVLATILRPDSGDAFVNGWSVARAGDQVRKSIGVVLANERSLYWRLDATDNLAMFGRLVGLSGSSLRQRAESLIDELQLGHIAGERVGRYSTGQRQRLMIARALLAESSVLLVDEPLRGLDADGVHIVVDLLARCAGEGKTVLVTAPLVAELVVRADSHARLVDGVLCSMTGATLPVGNSVL